MVRRWLESRVKSARLDQTAADRQGYEARDDYDKAAAEEWACLEVLATDSIADQAGFAKRIKELVAPDGYPAAGLHDDERFERHVRTALRKVGKMARTNEGLANTSRYK